MGGTALGASGRSNNGLKLDVKTGKLSLWRLFPTFTFTFTFAIYHSGREALLKLGLSKTQASNVLIDIHLHTVQAVYDLSLARRRLERGHCQVGVG